MPKILTARFLVVCMFATTLSLLLEGCNVLRVAKAPMETQVDTAGAACTANVDTLLVLLPGRYANINEFKSEGMVSAVRERGIAADVMLVDAHMGYYSNGTILDRLEADVFRPARAAGYRSVWLVGISLGGLGAVLHEEAMPGSIAGMVLLAPYLGERDALTGIEASGGLRAWKAPSGPLPRDPMEPRIWRWLQAASSAPAPALPRVYLGYGTEDRFLYSHKLLAAALPADRVFTTPGGHDWPEWRRLWIQALGAMPLPYCR
jgi:pimeloyl-ACP methyl ester carboxylesterase